MNYKVVNVATYQKKKEGNDYCGDRLFYLERDHDFVCVIVDGLGSGKMAGESSQVVIDVIKNNVSITDEVLVKKCVRELAGKRGVVLGILRINFTDQKYMYSSIGNISLMITSNKKRRERTIPKSGFLGSYERELKVVQGNMEKNMGFLMFSDGVSDQELSRLELFKGNVDEMIQAFSCINSKVRDDDTTLIAIKYTGEHFKADS